MLIGDDFPELGTWSRINNAMMMAVQHNKPIWLPHCEELNGEPETSTKLREAYLARLEMNDFTHAVDERVRTGLGLQETREHDDDRRVK